MVNTFILVNTFLYILNQHAPLNVGFAAQIKHFENYYISLTREIYVQFSPTSHFWFNQTWSARQFFNLLFELVLKTIVRNNIKTSCKFFCHKPNKVQSDQLLLKVTKCIFLKPSLGTILTSMSVGSSSVHFDLWGLKRIEGAIERILGRVLQEVDFYGRPLHERVYLGEKCHFPTLSAPKAQKTWRNDTFSFVNKNRLRRHERF